MFTNQNRTRNPSQTNPLTTGHTKPCLWRSMPGQQFSMCVWPCINDIVGLKPILNFRRILWVLWLILIPFFLDFQVFDTRNKRNMHACYTLWKTDPFHLFLVCVLLFFSFFLNIVVDPPAFKGAISNSVSADLIFQGICILSYINKEVKFDGFLYNWCTLLLYRLLLTHNADSVLCHGIWIGLGLHVIIATCEEAVNESIE